MSAEGKMNDTTKTAAAPGASRARLKDVLNELIAVFDCYAPNGELAEHREAFANSVRRIERDEVIDAIAKVYGGTA